MNNRINIFKIGLYTTTAFITIGLLLASIYTVDQGERAVVLRNGALISVAEPGLGFKIPVIDAIVPISVQENSRLYENIQAYSKDQQTGTMRMSVSYQISPELVSKVYSEYGSIDNLASRLLDRQVSKAMEEVFGQYNAITAVQERTRLGVDIQIAIQKAVQGYPIVIKSVQLENIDFSDAYEGSIEERMKAEVSVKTAEQQAQKEIIDANKEATIKVISAKATAAAQLATAEANAKAVKMQGEAEASAIKAKSDALANNPSLIQLTFAEKWDGMLPTTMVPNSTVPFLDIVK